MNSLALLNGPKTWDTILCFMLCVPRTSILEYNHKMRIFYISSFFAGGEDQNGRGGGFLRHTQRKLFDVNEGWKMPIKEAIWQKNCFVYRKVTKQWSFPPVRAGSCMLSNTSYDRGSFYRTLDKFFLVWRYKMSVHPIEGQIARDSGKLIGIVRAEKAVKASQFFPSCEQIYSLQLHPREKTFSSSLKEDFETGKRTSW